MTGVQDRGQLIRLRRAMELRLAMPWYWRLLIRLALAKRPGAGPYGP